METVFYVILFLFLVGFVIYLIIEGIGLLTFFSIILGIILFFLLIKLIKYIEKYSDILNYSKPDYSTPLIISSSTNYSHLEEKRVNELYREWAKIFNTKIKLEAEMECYKRKAIAAKKLLRINKSDVYNALYKKTLDKIYDLDISLKNHSYNCIDLEKLDSNHEMYNIFHKLNDYSTTNGYTYKFFNSTFHIGIDSDFCKSFVIIFLPYYYILYDKKQGYLKIEEYTELVKSVSYSFETVSSMAADDEYYKTTYLHERVSGGPDLRYNYNPSSIMVYRGRLNICNDYVFKFSNREKAYSFNKILDELIVFYKLKFKNKLFKYLDHLDCDNINSKTVYEENEYIQLMYDTCNGNSHFIDELKLDSLKEIHLKLDVKSYQRNVFIPSFYLMDEKEYRVSKFKVSYSRLSNLKYIYNSLYIESNDISLDQDIFLFRNICFDKKVNNITFNYSISSNKVSISNLEHINFPPSCDSLLLYLLKNNFLKTQAFKNMKYDDDGILSINDVIFAAKGNVDIYDTKSSTIINLNWINTNHKCKELIIQGNARNILVNKNINNCIDKIRVNNNYYFSVENGILYATDNKKSILLFSNEFNNKELIINRVNVSCEIPMCVSRLIFNNKISIKKGCLNLKYINEIIINDPSMKLLPSHFSNIEYGVTIKSNRSSIENIMIIGTIIFIDIENNEQIIVNSNEIAFNDKELIELEKKVMVKKRNVLSGLTIKDNCIIRYDGSETDIIIPDDSGANCINDYAFSKNNVIENIVVPSSVKKIKKGSFEFCNKLKEATIDDGVIEIEEEAFQSCKNLCRVDLPNSLTYIASRIFANCEKIKSIRIPEGVEIIKSNAFNCCSNLESISFPSSLKEIDEYAFYNCFNLKSVDIPESCIKIGKGAFGNCSNLERINGYNVEDGNLQAFNGTKFLLSKYVDNVFIKNNILYSYIGEDTEYSIPINIVEISDSAFEGNNKIRSIIIPDGLKKIGSLAFAFCSELIYVTIPESVKEIEWNAFYGSPKVCIKCYRGSYASKFRISHNLLVEYLSKETHTTPRISVQKKSSNTGIQLSDEEKLFILNMRRENEQKNKESLMQSKIVETNKKLENVIDSPIQDCDSNNVITNNIVQRWYKFLQSPTSMIYVLYLIDEMGNIISNKEKIITSIVDNEFKATFEIYSKEGFDNSKNYYLIIEDDKVNIVGKIIYKINISFSNDFDF